MLGLPHLLPCERTTPYMGAPIAPILSQQVSALLTAPDISIAVRTLQPSSWTLSHSGNSVLSWTWDVSCWGLALHLVCMPHDNLGHGPEPTLSDSMKQKGPDLLHNQAPPSLCFF